MARITKADREARERLRRYQARKQFHAGVQSRLRRDNLIALVGGTLAMAVLAALQVLYFATR
ncbi:hypothetical protein [Ruicaihuangia caeni]|uniref:hypothetical protein n=1 Tax=Ruicaihuangia caeni TaxID=3042517 RepID=UPI00338DB97B